MFSNSRPGGGGELLHILTILRKNVLTFLFFRGTMILDKNACLKLR